MQISKFKLIVTIIDNGHSDTVTEALLKTGAEQYTIYQGRGSGIHENFKLLSVTIEPAKDIVLSLVPENISESVVQEIEKSFKNNVPGKGVVFVLDVESAKFVLEKGLSTRK